jgi:hypothetical protein
MNSTYFTNGSTAMGLPSIEELRRIMDSAPKPPKPEFNSIVVSQRMLDDLLEATGAKDLLTVEFKGGPQLLGTIPVFAEDDLFARFRLVIRGTAPQPALIETESGQLVVYDPARLCRMARIIWEPEELTR